MYFQGKILAWISEKLIFSVMWMEKRGVGIHFSLLFSQVK